MENRQLKHRKVALFAIFGFGIGLTGCFSGELDLDSLPQDMEGCYIGPETERFILRDGVMSRVDGEKLLTLEGTYRGKGDRVLAATSEIFYSNKRDKISHGRSIETWIPFSYKRREYSLDLLDRETGISHPFRQARDLWQCGIGPPVT